MVKQREGRKGNEKKSAMGLGEFTKCRQRQDIKSKAIRARDTIRKGNFFRKPCNVHLLRPLIHIFNHCNRGYKKLWELQTLLVLNHVNLDVFLSTFYAFYLLCKPQISIQAPHHGSNIFMDHSIIMLTFDLDGKIELEQNLG